MKPKLIVILGPTASGKSDLALTLAQKYNGEIINADSRQIYQEMVIGTASPIKRSQESGIRNQGIVFEEIRHHLFGIVQPDYRFTLNKYKKRALETISNIISRYRVPLLVGGTGLYIWAVVDNLMIPEVPPNLALRAELESQSTEKLLEELKEKDPEAIRFTGKNKRRIIRALEVVLGTGKKFTEVRKLGEQLFDALQIGLSLPMDELDKHIESRARQMIKDGLIEEVQNLLKKYPPELAAFDSPGYREFIEYLNGKLTLAEATEQFIRGHKQLARRQMKWFKRDPRIQWFSPEERQRIEKTIRSFLKQKV